MAIFRRLRDVVYGGYFLFHLVCTVLGDAQLLFQRSLFPSQVVDLMNNYVKDYKDPLVGNNPIWFRSILYMEVIVMAPFLLVGTFGALFGARWMRTPSIIYSTAVITMGIPMISHILLDDFKVGFKVGPSTQEERLTLAGMYGGFFIMAIIILLDNVFFRAAPAYGGDYQGKVSETAKQSQKKRN